MFGMSAAFSVMGAMIEERRREHDAFMSGLDGLPEDERARHIAAREKFRLEERRHQDICAAIRASKPEPQSSGLGWGVLGLAVGLSLGD